MKVYLGIYPQGGIECLSEVCIFRRTCANHETAGEFRSEDGFTPELQEIRGEYHCASADRLPIRDDFQRLFPENYEDLGVRSMTLKDLQRASCIDYQI